MLLLLQLCPFNEDNDGFLISKNERKSDRYIINENDIIIITKKICICISSRYDYAAKEEVKEEKIFWRVSLASFRLTKMRSLYEIYPSLFIWPTSCFGYIQYAFSQGLLILKVSKVRKYFSSPSAQRTLRFFAARK